MQVLSKNLYKAHPLGRLGACSSRNIWDFRLSELNDFGDKIAGVGWPTVRLAIYIVCATILKVELCAIAKCSLVMVALPMAMCLVSSLSSFQRDGHLMQMNLFVLTKSGLAEIGPTIPKVI